MFFKFCLELSLWKLKGWLDSILFLLLIVSIYACQSNSNVGVKTSNNNKIEIDSSNYDISFLNELKNIELQFGGFILLENKMIFESGDTILFPEYPKLNKKITLTGIKQNLAIACIVERLNYTSITYRLEIVEFGNDSFYENGIATINPYFFIGAESNENQVSGLAYLVDEYSFYNDSCYTKISLGIESEAILRLLGKVQTNCNGKIKDITLNNSPVLIEK